MTIPSPSGDRSEVAGSPELIVITRAGTTVDTAGTAAVSTAGDDTSDLQRLLAAEAVSLHPLFSAPAPTPEEPSISASEPVETELSRYYHLDVDAERMEALAFQLNQCAVVEGAYVKPPAELATLVVTTPDGLAPAVTANFRPRQGYLDAGPAGIDADHAWGLPGGKGFGIKVVDCEWGWNLAHEDLGANSLGVVCGQASANDNHGTAVWGEIGADHNGQGVMGISPDALLGASSFQSQATSTGIKCAADHLDPGDIILLEIHRPGPNSTQGGQQGFIPIEWWPDDFAAIRYAVTKGIVVVEAAGNGWEDLDAAIYNTPAPGFPTTWTNPFRAANPQSGAVIVGAGDPPVGTHGRNVCPAPWSLPYVDRARCGFSNWGTRVDAQGWGWEVTTTGYGDLQAGNHNLLYTDQFSGTSSASPIVTGALACTQGVLKARGMPLLTSERARQLLRSTGTPQQATPGRPSSQRIGNRPSLRQLIPAALQQWVNNTTIRYCYALTASQTAWAFVDGLGWRQLKTGAADGVTNLFDLCCNVQASGAKAHLFLDDTYLYNLIQL